MPQISLKFSSGQNFLSSRAQCKFCTNTQMFFFFLAFRHISAFFLFFKGSSIKTQTIVDVTILASLGDHYKRGVGDDDDSCVFGERDRNFKVSFDTFLLAFANGRKIATSSIPEQYQFCKASNFTEFLLNSDIIPSHSTKDINAGIKLQNYLNQINILPFHVLYLVWSMNEN